MARKDGWTTLTVSQETAEAVRAFAAHATGQLCQRVTLDKAVTLAAVIARESEPPTLHHAWSAIHAKVRNGAGR